MNILIEIQYLPPVQYFSKFFECEKLIIDDCGFFERQSYRNRCMIAGANGVLPLIVPVKKARSRQLIRTTEIDNSRKWQREHWHSIRSAYGKSPFFEHYAHYFEPFYTDEQNNLFDFNISILRQCMKALKIPSEKLSLRSEAGESMDFNDFRNVFHPKTNSGSNDSQFVYQAYMQVFEERFGFLPGLSIIDLIFNEGPNAAKTIKKMLKL